MKIIFLIIILAILFVCWIFLSLSIKSDENQIEELLKQQKETINNANKLLDNQLESILKSQETLYKVREATYELNEKLFKTLNQ